MTGLARRQVLCFGNELHGDDGFGPAVGRALAELGLPGGWELHQLGTRGLDALALLQDCEAALLVDAEAPAGQPGRLRERRADELGSEASLVGHGMGLGFVLQALRAMPVRPGVLRILTAEMAEVRSFHLALSPAVAGAVEPAARQLGRWMQEAAHA
jgi:hydrogenase maturation protease